MPDIELWLLDITYAIGKKGLELRIYGIDRDGNRTLLIDRGFRPYFYALLKKDQDPAAAEERIRKRLEAKGIIGTERHVKKLFGKERNVVKIIAKIPEKVRELREIVKEMPEVEDVVEADIRFYMRYLIDHDLRPSSWIRVDDVEEVDRKEYPDQKVDRIVLAKTRPYTLHDRTDIPKTRTVAFDIEVYNPRGTPHPERDPIIIISLYNDEGKLTQFIADDDKNDRKIIKEFVNYIQEYDPDIILGYNSNNFDWPYLVKRSERIGVKLAVTRTGGKPEQSVYGHWSVIGRANVDLYNIIEEIPDIKIKSLDYVADYFGILPRDKRILIPGHRIYEYWDDKTKRELLIKYAEQDVYSTYKLGEKFVPFLIQLSYISGLPLDQVGAASVGMRVEWMIMFRAFKLNELAPNRVERPYESYKGAIVLEPKPGLHTNVAVLDFTSMYPNIMVKYNVSPDTYIDPSEWDKYPEYYEAPEVKHRFRKEPPGLYKHILVELMSKRKEVREQMKKIPKDSPDYIILDERQKALKIMANAMYGYCGWVGARWYKREVAEAVTAWARHIMKTVLNYAKKIGLEVIYGDTDSLFVRNDPEKINKLIEFVEKELGFEIKLEKVYKKIIFTEAKKRYVGLTEDDRIDIVGFEAVRADWAEIAKETQEKVAEIILKTGNIDEAIKYVHSVIKKLKNYEFDIDDVIIWKTLDKNLNEYKTITPHVYAAKKLVEAGFKVSKGDTIGYVIVKTGGGKIAYRAKPYILVKDIREIDVDYYIEHQVIPAAMRILQVFGVREDALLSGKRAKSITEFFS